MSTNEKIPSRTFHRDFIDGAAKLGTQVGYRLVATVLGYLAPIWLPFLLASDLASHRVPGANLAIVTSKSFKKAVLFYYVDENSTHDNAGWTKKFDLETRVIGRSASRG